MEFKRVLLIFYSLRSLIYCMESNIAVEELKLPNEDASIKELTGDKFYHVIPSSQILSNYLKIIVKENSNSSNPNYGNRAISYYQTDKNFKDRKQLSQNNTDTVIIWLNRAQFKNDFYLSIEFENPCEYYINISNSEYVELYLDEKYIYYVNEENKEMNFFFKIAISWKADITILAKGDKEITSTLSGVDYIKHSKYNSYIIELKNENNNYNVYFKVTGKIGDIINIGSTIFVQKLNSTNNISPFFPLRNSTYYGFLKKGLINNNCFISDLFHFDYAKILVIALDHDYNQIPISRGTFGEDNLIFCIDLKEVEYDELFYSFSFQTYISYFINSNIILKTLLGFEYSFSITLDNYAGFIPLIPTENFKFLTFSINDSPSNEDVISECSIYTCDNYPLCSLDSNDTERNLPIKKYNEYYDITFRKDELGKNYSPISKEQKLIKIKFTKLSSISENRRSEFSVNIYTEEINALHELDANSPAYKLIRNDQIEKIFFREEREDFFNNPYVKIYFIFEIISGNISISCNISKNTRNTLINNYTYKNYYLYEIYSNLWNYYYDLFFNITAAKDSVYTFKKGIIDLKYV